MVSGSIGQPINLTDAIQSWYSQKSHYDYDKFKCGYQGSNCREYNQMVWATSRHVGCAYHRCKPVNSFYYFVCNYGPRATYEKHKPFMKGPACSKCGNGAGWCKDKLCNSDCSSAGENCSCKAICYNCAELDMDTCRCSCADGWGGTDCSEALDPHAVAGQCPPIYGLNHSVVVEKSAVEGGFERCSAYDLSPQTTFVISQQMTVIFVMATIVLVVSNNAAL